MLRKVVRSMNLCASTDIRLTISPTVDERLAALVITSACRQWWEGRTTILNLFSPKHSVSPLVLNVLYEVSFGVRLSLCLTKIWAFCAYLPVDSSYESRAYIHAGDKAVLKVTVEDESLQEGCEEHEEGQRVAPPIRNSLLFCERDQHPMRVKKMNDGIRLIIQHWMYLKAAVLILAQYWQLIPWLLFQHQAKITWHLPDHLDGSTGYKNNMTHVSFHGLPINFQ